MQHSQTSILLEGGHQPTVHVPEFQLAPSPPPVFLGRDRDPAGPNKLFSENPKLIMSVAIELGWIVYAPGGRKKHGLPREWRVR